jgi:hypothetical protein
MDKTLLLLSDFLILFYCMIGCDITLFILCQISSVKYVDDTLFSDFLRVCDMAHSLFSEALFPIVIDHRTLSRA